MWGSIKIVAWSCLRLHSPVSSSISNTSPPPIRNLCIRSSHHTNLKVSTCLNSILVLIGSLSHLWQAALPFSNVGLIGAVLFFNGFHFLSGNSSAEGSADHYCKIPSNDFIQRAIYNTNSTTAHLAGIKYITSPTHSETLEMTEQEL
jgi:hypothetical protein